MRRECQEEYQENHEAGMEPRVNLEVYNPDQPWESAYTRGMHGISAMEYWHEYLEETCAAVLAKCHNIEAFVGTGSTSTPTATSRGLSLRGHPR